MKLKLLPVLLLTGTLLIVGPAGCNRTEENRVARFKGGILTIEDLVAHREILRTQAIYRDHPERLTPKFVLEHAVNMEMIIAKGLKEKLHLDPRIRARLHAHMSDLFLKVMQETLVPEIDREAFSEKEVRAYYEENQASYQVPAQYAVRVIRHADLVFLETLRTQIIAGETSFEAAVAAHSTDEASREKGGAVGLRALARYRPEWRAAIEPLAAGEVSAPVKIREACYLFQVTEITEPYTPVFEEKKAYVRNDLLYARYREEWRNTYDRLRREFDLAIDDHIFEHFAAGKETVAHEHH